MSKNAERVEELLKTKRELKNITIRELGKRLGISSTYYAEVERGEKIPSDHITRRISELLEIPEEELFFHFDKKPILKGASLEIVALKKTIDEVRRSKLNEDRKQELYDKIHSLYKHIKGKSGGD